MEDDEAVARGRQTLPKAADIRVLLVHTGERALEIRDRATPQALIIDVGLPDADEVGSLQSDRIEIRQAPCRFHAALKGLLEVTV